MTEDQALALAGTLGAMTLVMASLLSRQLPVRQVMRLALIWITIFGVGFVIVHTFLQ